MAQLDIPGRFVNVRRANGEVIAVNLDDLGPYPLWSAGVFATTQSSDLTIFQYAKGSGNVAGTSTLSTIYDTNVDNPTGQLLSMEQMVVYALRVMFPADIPLADAKDILNKVYYAHKVGGGGKAAAEGPVGLFPAGGGIAGITTQNAAEAWTNGHPSSAAVRAFAQPFAIDGAITIAGTFQFGSALSLAATRKIHVVADGMRSRYVQ